MLNGARNSYIKQANNIKNWRKIDKNELANLYLEHENIEPERSYYFSALMARYWSNVTRYYRTSRGLKLEADDFAMWLAEAFFVAFKYRRWKDPSHKLYSDPKGPDKVIKQSIYSVRMKHYQHSNMDKRKLNYRVDSIERQIEGFGSTAAVMDYIGVSDTDKSEEVCIDIINYLIDKQDIVGAITVDLICFGDTFKEHQIKSEIEILDDDLEFTENESDDLSTDYDDKDIPLAKLKNVTSITYSEIFSKRKLIATLRALDKSYVEYFTSTYSVQTRHVSNAINDLRKLDKDSNQLQRVITHKIELLSTDATIKDLLCL